jgi:hypothetical protein
MGAGKNPTPVNGNSPYPFSPFHSLIMLRGRKGQAFLFKATLIL